MENETTNPTALMELASMKLPLVEKDYELYFQARTRSSECINQRRNLEVTLTSTLTVVIVLIQAIPPLVIVILYLLIFPFYILDAATRSAMQTFADTRPISNLCQCNANIK